ncbi:MAG TPA: response regulator [Verrucomicrobiae bacterium]
MTKSSNQSYRILTVDDEPAVSKAMQMLLNYDGHEVQTADSGEAALSVYEPDKFDLVITDYSMVGMKGDQLAARIKQRRPDQPVIMVTAFANQFNSPGSPSSGADCVINKPFSLAELREAIVRVLN